MVMCTSRSQLAPREKMPLSDKEIRPALRSKILEDYGDTDSVLIEELGLCRGQVRVDMALVNGHLHGFEIKSDRDSLKRLGVQSEIYSKVFDRMTIVAGERHLDGALECLPPWWGVLQVVQGASGVRFKSHRKGRRNPSRDSRTIVELLWLDDAITLLEQRDSARGIRGKPRRVVWDKVCDCYTLDEIAENVRERLKVRTRHQDLPQPL
jgi:hypothetical protein